MGVVEAYLNPCIISPIMRPADTLSGWLAKPLSHTSALSGVVIVAHPSGRAGSCSGLHASSAISCSV